ncbi:MAG: TetR/AcrR family transcriptional regulator [Deltaproteobacteria bacterium]|nr:TetR/AcrR family transcriptional regulator [Deltaproteobacteria bacterium]
MEKSTFSDLKLQERETRKNLIIDAAERVFAVKQFDQVSMKEIAREAGISAASIYTYFTDQEHLFVEAFLRETTSLVDTLKANICDREEVDMEAVINVFLEYFSEHDAYFRMMAHFMLYGKIGSEALEKLNHTARGVVDLFDTIFIKMKYEGDDVRLMSHTFFAALNGIMINFRRYPGRSEEEILSHMKRLGKIVAELFGTYLKQKAGSGPAI